jgi:hypothetical protein
MGGFLFCDSCQLSEEDQVLSQDTAANGKYSVTARYEAVSVEIATGA